MVKLVTTSQKTIWFKGLVCILFFSLFVCSGCGNQNKVEIYVSVEGDDLADGSISSPFATLPKAVNQVRSLRESGNSDPAVIYLREGRHQLNKTLVLGLEDGLSADIENENYEEPGAGPHIIPAHLTIAAYPGEAPVVSAGVPVTGWKLLEPAHSELPEQAEGKVWVADIPTGLERFYTLYDAQGRLNRARARGFVPTSEGDIRTLHFPEGALKNWSNLKDVEINIRPGRAWLINMLPVESVDEENSIAKTAVNANYGMGKLAAWVHTRDGYSAWVENTLEALDKPGEWVINSESRKIYLWPSDPEWMVEHFKRTRPEGLERASIFGDPLFTNPEGGDFSFKEGSPALELGIEPLDVSKMGRKKN